MRRKNIFLAAVLSAAMVSSSVTPAFAESLTDGETAAMETAEETETETEPMEENGELENAADELLEAPENMAEDSRSTEDGEYAKEVIAQASNSSANMMGNISAIPYGVRKEETIYYTASKIYKHGEFKGVQIDQYTDLEQTPERHWITYRWHYKGEKWEVLRYSEKAGKLVHVNIAGEAYYNVWPEMFWVLRARNGYGYARTGYLINTEQALWDIQQEPVITFGSQV